MFKNIFKLVLILFTYLFLAQYISAFEFIKSTNNPLPVSYSNDYTSQLQANIFKEADTYKGIFTAKRNDGVYSLAYFESVNGVDWQMKKEILHTGVELSNQRILKTQTGYILFVTQFDNNNIYKIYSSICDFNFNCSLSLVPVITPDINNYSEKNGVFAVHPFKQGNRTYLFFGAWGNDGFKIKLAYSDDLVTWTRCPGDKAFLYGGDGPFAYSENNDLYLFTHHSDSSGVQIAKTILPLSCDSIFEDQGYLISPNQNYDQKHLIFPSIFSDNGGLKLYYSGLGSDSRWRLNLACTGQACLLPTPSPTPVPEKIPIIIIPGFMASWNRDAILHNKTVDYSVWKLQNFVKEYDGLIDTLKNIGYQQNANLFLFPYDWRQSIEKTTIDLNSYLQTKIWNNKPDQKVNLVGHSLGGLIARIFTQKNSDKVDKIISVGSPHFGTVQFYKPLEAGEIDRDNTFLWLAEKTILVLNKSTIESDKVTITNKFPVAKDLFPTFNFLKDSLGNEIPISNLIVKNSFLNTYNQNFSNIFPLFTAIYGEKDKNTPAGYIVEPQNIVDKLLGNYPDGKPKESYFDFGDYTILSKSAAQDTDSEKLHFDHGEIISKKEAIKKILGLLSISFSEGQIIEGQLTKISSSLIFMIKSPATMKVEFENNTYIEDEGIIFIQNAQSGSYSLKVQGTDQGKYEIIIGQISENNDIWEKIYGEITKSPPSSQIDNYNILYSSQTAFSIFPSPTVTPTIITPTLTPLPTPMPTATPTPLRPTGFEGQASILQSTNLTSSNNEIPMSKESPPSVLGVSSNEKELVSPTIKAIKRPEAKSKSKKSLNILNYIWPTVTSIILGGITYLFKRKLTGL